METVGAYHAKTHLPKLLERVAQGDSVVITKHGVPVAILQPFDHEKRIDTASVIAELRQFRSHNNLDGLTIKDMIAKGRR